MCAYDVVESDVAAATDLHVAADTELHGWQLRGTAGLGWELSSARAAGLGAAMGLGYGVGCGLCMEHGDLGLYPVGEMSVLWLRRLVPN